MEDNQLFEESLKKAKEDIGRSTILVVGKTGVGKSTLINSVFQEQIAETGQGHPITREIREYTKEGVPVNIIDTVGIEVNNYNQVIKDLTKLLHDRSLEQDTTKHIHLVWLCISEDSRRVESAEQNLVKELNKYAPIIAVITKARNDEGFMDNVLHEIPEVKNAVRVRAISEVLEDGHEIEKMGLESLIDLSVELIPEGQKKSFVAAQKISLEHKKTQAMNVVYGAIATAFGIGAVPIPLPDAPFIITAQVGMLAGISAVFGLHFDRATLGTILTGSFGGATATTVGRGVVNYIKLIPGVGTVVGVLVSGGTAAVITFVMGSAYIETLAEISKEKDLNKVTPFEIAELFKNKFEALVKSVNFMDVLKMISDFKSKK